MKNAEIKSCDDSTTLTFRVIGRSLDGIDFVAAIDGAPFSGEVTSSTYFSGPPSLLFTDMAKHWAGWKGEKRWSAIDGELSLVATSSSLGQISLIVEMSQLSGHFMLRAKVAIEAGQLDQIDKGITKLFADP